MARDFICKALFAIFSLLISGTDIRRKAVPRAAFVAAFPFFFAFKNFFAEWNPLWESIAGISAGLAIFLLSFFISRGKLGLADVWYSALTGMMLGPLWWCAATGIACLAGMVYLIASKKREAPFIPFMTAGSIAASIGQIFTSQCQI